MTAAAAASAPRPLRSRAASAGLWSLGGYAASALLRFGSNLLLARLLAPESFGLMAVATLVPALLMMFSDFGLAQNIVQSRRGEDPAFLDTAWTVQILRGIALWMVALGLCAALFAAQQAGAVAAGSAYAPAELPALVAVSAFALVITGFEATNSASAERGFDQRRLSGLQLASQLAGLAAMVPLALAFRSVWALVAGTLVSTLVTTLLSHLWLKGHRNRLRWDAGALRELARFGRWVFLSSSVTVLAASGDRLLLAALVDARVLGVYAIAALLVATLEAGAQRVLGGVALPALSETAREDPGAMRRVYYRLRLPADLALLFVAGALFVTGPAVVGLLYDTRYAGAGELLSVLALSLAWTRYTVTHQAFLACGRPRLLALTNVLRVAALYVLLPAGFALDGVRGAAWAIALHALATLPLLYVYKARLGLLDLRLELAGLAGLPLGLACGDGLRRLLEAA